MKKLRSRLIALICLFAAGLCAMLAIVAVRRAWSTRNLMEALDGDDPSGVVSALNAGADPNTIVPTHLGKLLPNVSMIERLLGVLERVNRPAEPVAKEDSPTALMFYLLDVRGHNTAIVQALLNAGANPNTLLFRDNKETLSAAYLSVAQGDNEVLRQLVAAGADVNFRFSDGSGMLAHPAGANSDTVMILIQAGADINARDNAGNTALHHAAADNQFAAVQRLLMFRPDVNARNKKGLTALDMAILRKNGGIIYLLRKAGAKKSKETDNDSRVE